MSWSSDLTDAPVRRRSEDPIAALVAVQQLMFGPVPAVGTRQEALLDLAFRAGEAGQSNDWMVAALNTACELWGKYPRPFERWTVVLGLVRRVRKVYPNSPNGEGWRP